MKAMLISGVFLIGHLFCFGQESNIEGSESTPPKLTPEQSLTLIEKELALQPAIQGKVEIDGNVTINLPEGYVYYNPESGSKILASWGNPAPDTTGDEGFRGLIFSNKYTILNGEGLTISVDINKSGYISDDKADDYDYNDILKSIQDCAAAENVARTKRGYPRLNIIGWATTPSYDKASHKLYFAKEINFENDAENTLNYDIHVLGRQGYVRLSFIGLMKDLNTVEQQRGSILSAVNYNPGYQYTDFKSGDKEAEQDFGSLLSGGNLVIAGGILALLLRFKKLLIIGFIVVASFIGKIFKRKQTT